MVRLATFVSSQIIHIILVHCQKKIRILAKKPACYGWSRCNGTYVFGSWARFTFTQKLDVHIYRCNRVFWGEYSDYF